VILAWIWLPAAVPAREWISAAQSGYSSSYHTQSWFDSLAVTGAIPEGTMWRLSHRLDLLRKERVSGTDLRQRNQRAVFHGGPAVARSLGWVLNLEGEENAFEESIARRTILAKAFGGLEWRPGSDATVAIEAGVVASRHTAEARHSDAGFAERLTTHWDLARFAGIADRGIRADAELNHSGDHRTDLPARETRWRWHSSWDHPGDTLLLMWSEEWADTRFYPAPDRFEQIARQESRGRAGSLVWASPPQASVARGMFDPRLIALRVRVEASSDVNSYNMTAGSPATLPNDTRTSSRGYQIESAREWRGLRISSGYRYRWNKDRFGETRRDQTGETGEWTAGLEWRFSSSDSAGAKVIFRATSYTVPGDSSFFDDRDQGERVFEVWWQRRVSKVLSVRPQFSFRSFRQIFISEQLSANNNTDDVYLLAPTILWTPAAHTELAQQFAIRAHYRYFDYERTDPQGRGTLYRKAESISGLRFSPTFHTTCHLGYVYRYEDFGGLYDREGWVQAVDWDRRSHLVDLQLSWRPADGLSLDPSFGLEYKRSFNHRRQDGNVVRIEDDLFRRHYIAMIVAWRGHSGVDLDLRVARRVQRFGKSEKDRDDRWQLTLSKGL